MVFLSLFIFAIKSLVSYVNIKLDTYNFNANFRLNLFVNPDRDFIGPYRFDGFL